MRQMKYCEFEVLDTVEFETECRAAGVDFTVITYISEANGHPRVCVGHFSTSYLKDFLLRTMDDDFSEYFYTE